jgi:hypothetical protein
MAIEITETHELVRTIRHFPPMVSYWLNNFYRDMHLSNTEYIDFDLVDKGRRLAPFVAPTVQGQPMVQRGHSVRKFKPAYIKPKDPVDPARLLKRRAGEFYGLASDATPQSREDAIIADILSDHREGIERRWEWMAARATIDGAIIIEGENYPRVQLSFGRKAEHTKVLAGAAAWTDTANSDPLADIEAWNNEMMTNSGYPITRLTFGPMAWRAFYAHPKVEKLLETRRGSTTEMEGGPGDGQPWQVRGTLKSANIELVVYSDSYEDNQGNSVPMMSTNDVVATNPAVDGIQAFGAIMDKKANWEAMPIFPKMWEQEDPSGIFIMTQSAPLMIPSRPNASMKITVR